MKCNDVRELIPFLDDGSVEPETADNIRRHLEECPLCQREYKEMKDMIHRVRRGLLENESSPVPGYLGMVRRRIDKKKKASFFYYRIVPAAAVIVFTVSIALYSFVDRKALEPVSEQYVMGESLNEFDDYIASQHLNGYDLNELVGVIEDDDELIMVNTLLSNNYINITPEDIIELMDNDALAMVFTSQER